MIFEKGVLANLLIERLNEIAKHDPVAMGKLIDARVECNEALADHPSVQVHVHDGPPTVGFLGMLNGIIGVVGHGSRQHHGLVTAVCEDDGSVSHFRRTEE